MAHAQWGAIVHSCGTFTPILQGCSTGIVVLTSHPCGSGAATNYVSKIDQYQWTTLHVKTRTVCIFLGMSWVCHEKSSRCHQTKALNTSQNKAYQIRANDDPLHWRMHASSCQTELQHCDQLCSRNQCQPLRGCGRKNLRRIAMQFSDKDELLVRRCSWSTERIRYHGWLIGPSIRNTNEQVPFTLRYVVSWRSV